MPCGSLPSRGGVLVIGGGGAEARCRCTRAAAAARCPRPPARCREYGYSRDRLDPVERAHVGVPPGSTAGGRMRAPIVRASTSVATLATWWSPNAMCSSTLCAGRVRVAGRWSCAGRSRRARRGPRASGSATAAAAASARPGRPGRAPARRVEVDRAGQQQAVVHRRHDQHRAREVGRDGGQRAARRCRPGCCRSRTGGACRSAGQPSRKARLDAKPFGWIIARPRNRKFSDPLLQAVGEGREAREVAAGS